MGTVAVYPPKRARSRCQQTCSLCSHHPVYTDRYMVTLSSLVPALTLRQNGGHELGKRHLLRLRLSHSLLTEGLAIGLGRTWATLTPFSAGWPHGQVHMDRTD